MTLQFDASPYLAAFKMGRETEDYNTEHPLQALNETAQTGNRMAQSMMDYQNLQRQKRLQELTLGQNAVTSGQNPGAMIQYLKTGQLPQADQSSPQDSSISNPSALMPTMRPGQGLEAYAGTPDTGPRIPQSSPTPVMSSPLVANSPWNKPQGQSPQQPTGFSSLFQGKKIDYNDVIDKLNNGDTTVYAGLTPNQQATVEKIREFQQKQQDKNTMTFIGTNKDGDPVFADKRGNLKTSSLGSPIQPKPQAVTTQGATFSGATPQEQQLAISMVKGNIRPADLSYRDRGRVVALANDYANQQGIPFQSYSGNVKEKFAENISSGKMGMNSLSLNTALGHIGSALDAYQKVGNTNQAWLNQPINYLKTKTNDPNIVALGNTLTAVQGELANVFKNSGGTDQEIAKWQNNLSENLTPDQAKAALGQIGELLRSRLGAMEYQQQNVMGGTNMGRQLLSPHGSDVMQRIGQLQSGGLMWKGKQLKDTPANRAWLAQQQGGQQ